MYPDTFNNSIIGFTNGVSHIRIATPPVKGKANEELRKFLRKALGVNKSSLEIVKGATSRNKVLAISSLSQEDISESFHLNLDFSTAPVKNLNNGTLYRSEDFQPGSYYARHLTEDSNSITDSWLHYSLYPPVGAHQH